MSDLNNKLDNHIKFNKRKSIFIYSLVVAVTIPLLIWQYFPPLGEVTETSGTVMRLTGLPSDDGEILFLLVKLQNGLKVRVNIPNSSFYRKGEKVILIKFSPLLFGNHKYKFKEYENNA